jgi:hypothetical protein
VSRSYFSHETGFFPGSNWIQTTWPCGTSDHAKDTAKNGVLPIGAASGTPADTGQRLPTPNYPAPRQSQTDRVARPYRRPRERLGHPTRPKNPPRRAERKEDPVPWQDEPLPFFSSLPRKRRERLGACQPGQLLLVVQVEQVHQLGKFHHPRSLHPRELDGDRRGLLSLDYERPVNPHQSCAPHKSRLGQGREKVQPES